jgi:hypothetical protein
MQIFAFKAMARGNITLTQSRFLSDLSQAPALRSRAVIPARQCTEATDHQMA